MKKVLLMGFVALLAAAVFAPTASAHLARGMAEWQKLGQVYFPDACSPVEIDASHPFLGSDVAAMAPVILTANSDLDCTITLGRSFHRLGQEQGCTVVVHEYGHLAGLTHSSDPNSIMHRDPAVVPECASPRTKHRLKMRARP